MTLEAASTWWSARDAAYLGATCLLLLVATAALVRAAPALLRSAQAGLTRRRRLSVWLALATGAWLRLAVMPDRHVMLWTIYRITDDIAQLVAVPKYGPGSAVLHRLVFALTSPDDQQLIATHRVLAVLALPLSWALLTRLLGLQRVAGLLAWTLALLPPLLLDAASESILQVAMPFVWGGLLAQRAGRRWTAGLCLAFAATVRPELALVLPAAAWLLRWSGGRSPRALGVAWLPLLVASAAMIAHAAGVHSAEVDEGSLPPLGLPLLLQAAPRLVTHAAVLDPAVYPAGLLVLALLGAGLAFAERDRAPLALGALALVWMGSVVIDLPRVSIPRLHAPAMVLVTGLSLLGLQRLGGARRRLAAGALVVLSAGWPAAALWPPGLDEAHDAWRRAALAELPQRGGCLVALDWEDGPRAGNVERKLPDYLLRAPWREVERLSVDRWRRGEAASGCPAGVYGLVDLRCYARDPHIDAGRGLLAPCQTLRDAFTGAPLAQTELRAEAEHPYGWWGGERRFAVSFSVLRPAPGDPP